MGTFSSDAFYPEKQPKPSQIEMKANGLVLKEAWVGIQTCCALTSALTSYSSPRMLVFYFDESVDSSV